MLKFFGFIAPRRAVPAMREVRATRPRGPLAKMMACDVNNLDRLAQAWVQHRL